MNDATPSRREEGELIANRADNLGTRLINLSGDIVHDCDVPNELLFIAEELCEFTGLIVRRARRDYELMFASRRNVANDAGRQEGK